MALNIKDPRTDELARQLAQLTGESLTDAVRVAMEERLARLRRHADVGQRGPDLMRYVERGRGRATLDARPADEILGYGPDGLPS